MTKREQNIEAGRKFVAAINVAGIIERLFGYFISYIIILIVGTLVINETKILSFLNGKINETLMVVAILFLFATPLIFWERSIRKFRRANGLSVYGNIVAELEQREIDERVRKEHLAFVNNGIVKDGGLDKGDIGYWFKLLKDGAITQEEYEAKKRELM